MKKWIAAVVLLFAGSVLAADGRPNIVMILADDLGYSDIGCFGSEIPTPNIDSIGHDGVAFTQFYNQARCCPSRACLMTGKYPHQVGIGEMIDEYARAAREAAKSPAYADHLSKDVPTIAEILKASGYHTMMCGKWHLGRRPEEWPVKRGFERSFVQINGAMNYFGGPSGDTKRDAMAIDDKPYTPPHDGFYSTDAFADHAIEFLKESPKDKPFFLYMPFNASHWPLQAPEGEIASEKGKYDAGWQAIREARLAKMKKLGVVAADQVMSPMDRGKVKPWNELNAQQKAEWSRRMEVYAAQTAHLDAAVGRLLATLDEMHVAENTMVIFMSDNGGAAEDPNRGDMSVPVGSRDTFKGYARPWATVSNTPWRYHKVTAFEGGISTPLLVKWPGHVGEEKYIREAAHITDLVPTFLEVARTAPPKTGLEGKSLAASLESGHAPADRVFCWEHEGNRAIRKGDWKLVSLASGKWELFDMSKDRIESHDLSSEKAELVKELEGDYGDWAQRCGVIDFKKLVTAK